MRMLALVRVVGMASATLPPLLTRCDTRCTVAPMRSWLTAAAVLTVLLGLPAAAAARPASAAKDGRPNILVVMTDDQAAADLAKMPNVRKLLAKQGTSFAGAVDSFPLCCPSRATFITGQYAHNHRVLGNFYPYGWYGMKGRGGTPPPPRPQRG